MISQKLNKENRENKVVSKNFILHGLGILVWLIFASLLYYEVVPVDEISTSIAGAEIIHMDPVYITVE